MSAETVSKTITQVDINRYADATGDHNPIHVDPEFAESTELGSTIAHGMMLAAYISELLLRILGEQWLEHSYLKVSFKRPAKPGESVIASAEPFDDIFKVKLVNQRDDLLIQGTARLT